MAQKKTVKNMMKERIQSQDTGGRKAIIDLEGMDPRAVYEELKHNYTNIYYNLFMDSIEWEGDIDYRETRFVMNKLWSVGRIAMRPLLAGQKIFTDWAGDTYDWYGNPATVMLINEYNAPQSVIPSTPQVVDRDVAIGWVQPNHKPMRMSVDWYIRRLAQVDMVINTNLNLHKLPFLIPVDSSNQARLNSIVQRILNNEVFLFVGDADPALFKAVSTGAPYIIDKLCEYRHGLENELRTLMGIDNQGGYLNREQQNLDTTNSNNDIINMHRHGYVSEINAWCDRCRELGRDFRAKSTTKPVTMAHGDEQPGWDDTTGDDTTGTAPREEE